MSNPFEAVSLTEKAARQQALNHSYGELGHRISPSEGTQQADGSWSFGLAIVGCEPDEMALKQIPGALLTVRPDGRIDGTTHEELVKLIGGK
ncbi:hypothetical protein KKC44_01135 [Patescibacteria group bacterium]|nr:hypothetical protein [Patescibacteria group bacterium]MBU2259186.1 hypothetical protein [Patescibacteria group bacterium]